MSKFYKIGEVAREAGVSVELIRAYEREGLIIPHKTDSGQRLYNDDDKHWLSCIRRLITEQGLNLEGIRRMLSFMPCWKLKGCDDENRDVCPAYTSSSKPCWMIKHETKGECQDIVCRDCVVYKSAFECDNLKSLINKIS